MCGIAASMNEITQTVVLKKKNGKKNLTFSMKGVLLGEK